jgi:hypothetical protein
MKSSFNERPEGGFEKEQKKNSGSIDKQMKF